MKFVKYLIVFVFVFFLVYPVFAQDTPPVIPPDVLSPDQALNGLLALFMSTFAAFTGSMLTTTIVSVLKLFVPSTVDAGILKNIVGALLTVLYWLAVRYGFSDTFASVGQAIITIVPALIALFGTIVGSSALHKLAVKYGFPIFSYKRTP